MELKKIIEEIKFCVSSEEVKNKIALVFCELLC